MEAEKPAILLVDDHHSNLLALEAVLGTSDYDLITASSGTEALAMLEVHDVALVLLDIQMPEMDGFEVARRMKTSEKTRNIPVIFITAIYKEDPYIQKGYEIGAVDFFAKPFNPDVLRLKVGIYSELYRKNLQLDRRAAELDAIIETIPNAIYVGDNGGITRCNEAALSLFGLSDRIQMKQDYSALAVRAEMRYPDTGEPIPSDDQPLAHALRGETFMGRVLIRHVSSGKDVTFACAATPIILQKQIVGAVVVNMDIPKSN